MPAEGLDAEIADSVDDPEAEDGIADDAAFADFLAAGLELGLDEGDGFPAGAQEAVDGRQDEAEGDERDVGDGEIGRFGQIAGLQMAGIAAIEDDDAGIGGQAGVELGFPDVDGVDLGGAVLEKAIGEPAGRGADVHADLVPGGQAGEAEERFFEFEAAAADETLGLADAEGAVGRIFMAGLEGGRIVHEDFAGENEPLGLLAAFGEAAFHQKQVQAGALHFPFALRSWTPRYRDEAMTRRAMPPMTDQMMAL